MHALLAIRKNTVETFFEHTYGVDMNKAIAIARLIESRADDGLFDSISITMPVDNDLVNLLRAAGYNACLIDAEWDYAYVDGEIIPADDFEDYELGGICVSLFKVY
jgi:hypothetical protein